MSNTSSSEKGLKNKPASSKWLLGVAWSHEILWAGITILLGLLVAIDMKNAGVELDSEANTLTILPFIIIAIVGLMKIPLAMAFYSSKKILWKTITFTFLILLIVISFETNLSRMERNFNNHNFINFNLINQRSELESLLTRDADLMTTEKINSLKKEIMTIDYRLNRLIWTTPTWRLAAIYYNIEPAEVKIKQVQTIQMFNIVFLSLIVSLFGTLLAFISFVVANRTKKL